MANLQKSSKDKDDAQKSLQKQLPGPLSKTPFQVNNGKYSSYSDFQFVAQGGFGTTYKARDKDGKQVLFKELNLRIPGGMGKKGCWEIFDCFEKEANTLKNLDNPNIPKYVDSFARDVDGEVRFYLVTEYVEGSSLEHLLGEGKSFTESEAIRIAKDALEILRYLQGFSPPILHRDITPSNILLDDKGKVWLVDFGSVTLKSAQTLKGTMCGTLGYAAPEQILLGKASPSSDVYGLGASLIRILTREEPTELFDGQSKFNLRKKANLNKAFAKFIKRMIQSESRRFRDAEGALKALEPLCCDKLVLTGDIVRDALVRAGHSEPVVNEAVMKYGGSTQLVVASSSITQYKGKRASYLKASRRCAKDIAKITRSAKRLVRKGILPDGIEIKAGDMTLDVKKDRIWVRDKNYDSKDIQVPDNDELFFPILGGSMLGILTGIFSTLPKLPPPPYLLGEVLPVAFAILTGGVIGASVGVVAGFFRRRSSHMKNVREWLVESNVDQIKAVLELPALMEQEIQRRTERLDSRAKEVKKLKFGKED